MRHYHAGPLLLFAALSVLWTFPLVMHMGTHVPGAPGDNYLFLWNFWWARLVLTSSDLSFFHSPYLFAPFGVDLVNHPHTALQGFLAATVLARVELVAALNLVILLSVFANFACAYWLTYDIARHRRAATLGAVIFGASPYVSAHLLGHFDLLSAWVLPLFGLCLRRALATEGTRWMIACGVVLALAAYSAYYYVVYLGLMAGAYVIGHLSLPHFRIEARLQTTPDADDSLGRRDATPARRSADRVDQRDRRKHLDVVGTPGVDTFGAKPTDTRLGASRRCPAHQVASAASSTGPGTRTLVGCRPHSWPGRR